MFIVKENPITSKDGLVKEGIKIENGVLTITRPDENTLKFEDGKWYTFGDDGKWYYLGLGANPVYETDTDGILDADLFNAVFEEQTTTDNVETTEQEN